MAFWDAIVLIVLIGAVVGVANTWLGRRPVVQQPDADALRAQDEVRQLKERIQVLERVITDNHGSRTLDNEIERLRDR